MSKVEFKKLFDDAILPKKAHESDAGFDLYAHSFYDPKTKTDMLGEPYILRPNERILVKCGFAMSLSVDFEAQIRPRSGLALKNGITVLNSPGTIDSSYRNEIGVILLNTDNEIFKINKGDRIAQMVIHKLPFFTVKEVSVLKQSEERGLGGFGSTGV